MARAARDNGSECRSFQLGTDNNRVWWNAHYDSIGQSYLELPRVRVFSDFHCVTTWSRLGNLWEGSRSRRNRPAMWREAGGRSM